MRFRPGLDMRPMHITFIIDVLNVMRRELQRQKVWIVPELCYELEC